MRYSLPRFSSLLGSEEETFGAGHYLNPGAIGHHRRVKAAAITNSASLILSFQPRISTPFNPLKPPFPTNTHPQRLSSFPQISSSRFEPALLPFTCAHYTRKSNFLTRTTGIQLSTQGSLQLFPRNYTANYKTPEKGADSTY